MTKKSNPRPPSLIEWLDNEIAKLQHDNSRALTGEHQKVMNAAKIRAYQKVERKVKEDSLK